MHTPLTHKILDKPQRDAHLTQTKKLAAGFQRALMASSYYNSASGCHRNTTLPYMFDGGTAYTSGIEGKRTRLFWTFSECGKEEFFDFEALGEIFFS